MSKTKTSMGFLNRLKGTWEALQQLLGADRRTSRRRAHRLAPLQELEDRCLLSANPVGAEFRVNTTTTGPQQTFAQTQKAVAIDLNGNSVAVWSSQNQDGSGWGVYAQRLDANGSPLGSEFRVNTTTSQDQQYATVAVNGSGDFVITWASRQSGNWDIYAQRFLANGSAQGSEILVNNTTAGDQLFPSVGINGSRDFMVTWSGDQSGTWNTYAQLIKANGNPLGNEILVSNPVVGMDQMNSSISMNDAGNSVITWSGNQAGDWNVYAQRFDTTGTPVGSIFQVNTTTANDQQYASGAIDPYGDFVLTWSSQGQDGNGWGVYANRYTSSGVSLGGEFRVNSTTTDDQMFSSVATDDKFDLLFTWSSKQQDGSGWGIYAQQVKPNGGFRGTEFLINTTTTNDQQYASVASDSKSSYLVLWSSDNQDGNGSGVYAQRFTDFPISVSPTSGLSTTESGGTATFSIVLDSAPTANVTIPISSSNTAEGTTSVAALVFTSANWSVPQTVTITGVDDFVIDGPVAYSIVTGAAVSSDFAFSGKNAADVLVTNLDNETGVPHALSGRISEDVNGNGAVLDDGIGRAGVTVRLYKDNGNGAPGAGDALVASTTTDAAGNYSFAGIADGVYWISIDSKTITPSDGYNVGFTQGDVWAEQTYGAAGSVAYNGSSYSFSASDGAFFGGKQGQVADNAATVAGAEHLLRVNVAGIGNFTGLDAGFSFNVVTRTGDGDNDLTANRTMQGSLRQFLQNSNAIVGINSSQFAIPSTDSGYNAATGAFSILPTSALPTVTDAVVLDGTTQSGFSGSPLIEINGQSAGANRDGITISAGNSTVRGLVINRFTANGIKLLTNGNNVIEGNYLGTDVTGTLDRGNTLAGVLISNSANNQVGGTTAASRNLISGNNADGIQIVGVGSTGNLVQGNSIGTNLGGTASVGNTLNGIWIGTGASNNTIGGIPAGAGNLISGNIDDGVEIEGSTSTGNLIQGNFIGTNAAGSAALGNDTGIVIQESPNNVIGGAAAGAGNLISGNRNTGILIFGSTATGIGIRGNLIGTDQTGVLGIANSIAGVWITQSGDGVGGKGFAVNASIGGIAPGEANTIAFNIGEGVLISGGTGHTVRGNSLFANTRLGIDLGNAGTAVNDTLDGDNGANGLQNYPVISGASIAPGQITISGTLISKRNDNYVLDFYASPTADPLGNGEGATYLGSTTVSTNTSGTASFASTFAVSVPAGSFISATATDQSGNTSEFSTNKVATGAGIVVSPTSGLATTEAGGTAAFKIALISQPTADVTIGLSSSDPAEGVLSTASLTFTSANWSIAQTVTVTGVDDLLIDGNISYTIVTAPSASADATYNNLDAADVSVTNLDDDFAGIFVSPASGLTTSEGGGTDTFTVVLTSVPIAPVTIGISSSDPAEGVVSASSLTFTLLDWNIPQTVTVTGVDDLVADGNVGYSILTAPAVSLDPFFNGLDSADVLATNLDDDVAGVLISPISGPTTEAGGAATFDVALRSQPTADVAIGLSSSNAGEGTLSTTLLTFTPANWNVAQTVTITGVDDLLVDGNIVYNIVTAPAVSADASYNNVNPGDVAVTNLDDDAFGITVGPISGPTTESGGTATFSVGLNSQPTADVTINLSSSDPAEGTLSTVSLTFTSINWNVAQTVTVTGVDDFVADGNRSYTIVTAPAVSADLNYNGSDAVNVVAVNQDNDTPGINVGAISGPTTEGGGTATFTVTLNSQPTADVTIGVSSSNAAEGTPSTASLTFTSANWNVVQTVTVTGVDDFVADGNTSFAIVTAPAVGGDAAYLGVDAADVVVVNQDNDTVGINISVITGPTTEAGGTATFVVVLNSQPTADVIIGISSSNSAEGIASTANLTFTGASWNVAQSVTVTGVEDFVVDGNVNYTIVTAAASSSDPGYNGFDAADVSAVNQDDDVAGITPPPPTLIAPLILMPIPALLPPPSSSPSGVAGVGNVPSSSAIALPLSLIPANARSGNESVENGAPALMAQAESVANRVFQAFAPIPRATWQAVQDVGNALPEELAFHLPPSRLLLLPSSLSQAPTAPADDLFDVLSDDGERVPWTDSGIETTLMLGTGILAGTGYLLLNSRLGLWLLGLVTAQPMWKQFDPLEVLYAWEEDDRNRTIADEDEETLMSLVD